MSYSLSFKTKEGESFTLDVESSAEKIEDLKVRLISMDESFEECTLLFKGKICKDDKTLEDCGMVSGAAGNVVVMRKKGKVPASKAAEQAATAASAAVVPPGTAPAGGASAAPPAGGPSAPPQAPAAEKVTIDPAVVETIMAMGICADRAYVEQMLQKTKGNADLAMAWILEPEQMLQEEQQHRQARRQARAQQQQQSVSVQPMRVGVEKWSDMIQDGVLINGATSVQDAAAYLDNNSKECILLLLGGATERNSRGMVQHLQMIYAMAEPQLCILYVPFMDQDEAKFGDFIRTMPWGSLKFNSPSMKLLDARFSLRYSHGSVLIQKSTGHVLSYGAVNDMLLHNFDYNTAKQHWLARGHIVRPAPFTKENPTGKGTGAVSSTGAGAGGGQPAVAPPVVPQPVAAPQAAVAAAAKPTPATSSSGPAATAVLPGGNPALELVKVQDAVNEFCEVGDYTQQEEFFATLLKVLNNIAATPTEQKFQAIKNTNAKLFGPFVARVEDPNAMVDVNPAPVGDRPGIAVLSIAHFAPDGDFVRWNASAPNALPDLIALRNHLVTIAKKSSERKFRFERDQKIAVEMEKDKGRQTKYGGAEGSGKMTLGQDRRKRGGG